MAGGVTVFVYSPANMSAIDGSSVWVQTMTLALASVERVAVSLLLSHPVTNPRLVAPLLDHPSITVVDPFSDGARGDTPLESGEAAALLASRGLDGVVVRGAQAARRLAAEPALRGRIWPYLTDIPQHVLDIDRDAQDLIGEVMAASPVILCQTEEMRTFLEGCYPGVAGKGWLLPPTIPEGIEPVLLPPPTPDDLRLCYSGKFARMWNTLEMCELPARLAERGITTRLTMVGDKINRDPQWPGFVPEMRSRLERSAGVDWVGGVSRERSIELMTRAHIGLSWRSPALDDSLELSTKLLEYCAAGTPPLLNRTAMHERIFGTDYPLFVTNEADVLEVLARICDDPAPYRDAIDSVAGITSAYTLEKTAQRLARVVDFLHPLDSNRAGISEAHLVRPKMDGARFHVGYMVSSATTESHLKDLSALMSAARALDPRLILFLHGELPATPAVQQALADLVATVGEHAVVLEGDRPGLGGWLRKVGFVVGFGDDGRAAKAAASGVVPVLVRGVGRWRHDSVESASRYLAHIAGESARWLEACADAVAIGPEELPSPFNSN